MSSYVLNIPPPVRLPASSIVIDETVLVSRTDPVPMAFNGLWLALKRLTARELTGFLFNRGPVFLLILSPADLFLSPTCLRCVIYSTMCEPVVPCCVCGFEGSRGYESSQVLKVHAGSRNLWILGFLRSAESSGSQGLRDLGVLELAEFFSRSWSSRDPQALGVLGFKELGSSNFLNFRVFKFSNLQVFYNYRILGFSNSSGAQNSEDPLVISFLRSTRFAIEGFGSEGILGEALLNQDSTKGSRHKKVSVLAIGELEEANNHIGGNTMQLSGSS
ncbi:hypothetical protein WH47_07290 [Habropoda laboriosa]|uniref:Uncharacterized protein n=1 Tax=Habropoda laboriosa TaxID=597456 RepID=A0A0L7R630_9HYME|nr:hypothetical protein WH47_07290 [Habropoda laboriosa]